MAASFEVLFTSEITGQLWNTCVWDPHSGTSLTTYKGHSASPRTLCMLRQDLLMCGVNNKSVIHIWPLHRKEQIQQRMVCSGAVSALTVSPDGLLCVAAIAEKIHIWQITSGRLLAILGRHYQNVTCLRFTDDGSHLVSAGEDSLVLVWSIASVLSDCLTPGGASPEPRHLWSQHALPVTDIAVGKGGIRARVATSSLDNTVRLWEIASGELLLTLVFEHALMSVALDAGEQRLYAGTATGKIHQVNLFIKPVRVERMITDSSEDSLVFAGHSNKVTCLCVSMDATTLISGSHDCTVRVWDVYSRQCVKSILHKGAITNIMLTPTPPCLTGLDVRPPPSTILPQFQRHLACSEADNVAAGSVTVTLRKRQLPHETIESSPEESYNRINVDDLKDKLISNLERDNSKLRLTNSELYKCAIDQILTGNNT